MRSAVLIGLVLVGVLAAACGGDADDGPLTSARAKQLVAEATAFNTSALNQILALGARVTPRDVPSDTFSSIFLWSRVGEVESSDLRFALGLEATPRDVAAMFAPVAPGVSSVLHAGTITDVTCEVEGRVATGVVSFGDEKVLAGRLRYRAVQAADGWRVVEITVPASGIRLRADDAGVWTYERTARTEPLDLVYGAAAPAGFGRLLATDAWAAADPAFTDRGLLRARHVATGLVFHLVPPGAARVPARAGEPRGAVRVAGPAFLVAATECTQAAWDAIGGQDERVLVGSDLPIHGVSWADVSAWCERAGLALPTAAQWTWAAQTSLRAEQGLPWTPDLGKRALYRFPGSGDPDAPFLAAPVASREPNEWGLYDVQGNVAEWCADAGDAVYEEGAADWRPAAGAQTGVRVHMGGGWDDEEDLLNPKLRRPAPAAERRDDRGVRPIAPLPD